MSGWGSWQGPAAAYLFTAALAEGAEGAAAAALQGLGPDELRGVVIALGAQARHAAVVAGQHPGAAQLREQERTDVQVILSGSPALPLALAALTGTADLAGPAQQAAGDLVAAASALAMVTIRAMTMAGWPKKAVAVICRRSIL